MYLPRPALTVLVTALGLLASACGSPPANTGVAERVDRDADTATSDGDDESAATVTMETLPDPDGQDDGDRSGDDGSDGDDDDGGGEADDPAVTSTRFVAEAINREDPRSYLAADSFDHVQRGGPYDPDDLRRRFSELDAFAGQVASVRPSPDAYPDDDPELAPSCASSYGPYCQVDLLTSDGSRVASVIVYWFGEGVTGFTVVERDPGGAPIGVGTADCSPGYQVIHGGQTIDRFDISVCVDGSGQVEYNGRVRNEDLGITLPACRDGESWVAHNGATVYRVAPVDQSTRSHVTVTNPDGTTQVDAHFTRFEHPPVAEPDPC